MSAWNKKKVLVTGASGFIGSHLVKKLLNNKLSVVALIWPNPGILAGLSGDLEIVKLDITKPFDIKDVGGSVDTVIHFAGIVGEGACSKDVRYAYNLNIAGVVNLINCFHGSGLNKFVYLGSASVYDRANVLPISEGGKTLNSGIYNSTKLAAELLVSGYCSKYNISCCIGRATNTYGPRQLEYSVVSHIIMELLKHDQLTLFNPYDVKDFIYVTDVAEAIITLRDTKESGIFNISSGQGIQLSVMVKTVADILDKDVTLKAEDEDRARKNSTELIIDNSRLKGLGWRPKISLHEGMQETINYFKQRIVNGDVG